MHPTIESNYWTLMSQLGRDSFLFLRYRASGLEPPRDPLSESFAISYGISNPSAVKQILLDAGLIDEAYRIVDKQLAFWIDRLIFPPLGLPPKTWRLFPRIK